jgi:glycosyltransferase involved in cell wall biosynthesis
MRTRIEHAIAAFRLERNVTLLGRIGDEELRAWYRRATLTVMPSTTLEGFGLSTAESLLCGTPVLVTPIGANPELVAGLDRRFVASAADPNGLAHGILGLLEAPETLEATRRRLPGAEATAWSWDSVAAQYLELYASRLGARR